MAITPIQSTRVSLQLQSQRLLEAIRASRYTSYTEQSRLASGRNFLVPSDDPIAANHTLKLGQTLDQYTQLLLNITYASNRLDATDEALGDVSALLSEAHTLASQNAGSMTSSEERAAAAELVASIREQLMLIGNRQFEGRYLFAGRNTTLQPFQSLLGGEAFLGDRGEVLARVGETDYEAINVTGDALFGALAAGVFGSVDLDPAATADTRLEDLAGAKGLGIRKGVLIFNEVGGAGVVQVDVTNADTLGDVVDLINAAATQAGAGFTAALTATGLTITPAGELSITDAGAGAITADLGILTDPPVAAPIVGTDLGVRLTRTTLISDLVGGASLDLTDPIRITNGSQSEVIDLSEAETIQDICNRINSAGLSVNAEINEAGTGLDVLNLVSGIRLTISEDGGTTAADLGIRSLDASTNLSLLNYGQAFETALGEADLRITAKDGSTLDVDLDGVATLGDVIDRINQTATDVGVALTASITDAGDGWRIVDATGGGGVLSVSPLNYDNDAAALGIKWSATADPAATELVMTELTTARSDNVLAALTDLEQALVNDDTAGITAAADRVNALQEEVTRWRGVVGARAKGMQDRRVQMENANAATEVFLSEVQDLDYAEAATRFQQAQTALQASLLTGAQVMTISLLDYLT